MGSGLSIAAHSAVICSQLQPFEYSSNASENECARSLNVPADADMLYNRHMRELAAGQLRVISHTSTHCMNHA